MDESLTPHGLKCPDITKSRFRWNKEDKLKQLVQSVVSYKLTTVKIAAEAIFYALVLPLWFLHEKMKSFLKNLAAFFYEMAALNICT